jgi:hypothetical protein
MPCPSHPPWLHHSNYAWRRVQVMRGFWLQVTNLKSIETMTRPPEQFLLPPVRSYKVLVISVILYSM